MSYFMVIIYYQILIICSNYQSKHIANYFDFDFCISIGDYSDATLRMNDNAIEYLFHLVWLI